MLFYFLMENKPFLLSADPFVLLLPCALLTPRGAPLPVFVPDAAPGAAQKAEIKTQTGGSAGVERRAFAPPPPFL